MSTRYRDICELVGWITFVASALFYLAAGIRAGDVLSVVGGALFFAACLMFLAPIMRSARYARIARRAEIRGQGG